MTPSSQDKRRLQVATRLKGVVLLSLTDILCLLEETEK